MKINLIVLRSKDIHQMKTFYEDILSLKFCSEQHGSGPYHYSTDIDGTVLEIYPIKKDSTEGLRLGFQLESFSDIKVKLAKRNIEFTETHDSIVFTDPDGHKIEIR